MTETKRYLPFLSKKIDTYVFVIAVMFLLTIATGFVNQMILSFGIVICCVVLLFLDKMLFAFPFMLFYYVYYGRVLGVSVFRVFTLLLVLSVIFKYAENYRLKNKHITILAVYSIYLIVVMMPQGIDAAIYVFLDIICCFILVDQVVDKDSFTESFFKIYTGVCFSSYLTGIVCENTIGGGYNYTRFNATFEDPNYMGFFFTVAIFAVISLNLFSKRFRIVVVIALYAMMMASLSMTAIVVNILLWLFYGFVTESVKPKIVFGVLVIVVVLAGIYYIGLQNPDIPVLSELVARIREKIMSLNEGDMGDFTSGRTNHVQEHLEFYFNSSPLNILLGGIPVNTRYIYPAFEGAAHNEYVDMLLNVGVVGFFIMFGYFFWNYFTHIRNYRATKDTKDLFIVMIKTVWLCYAMTLTMFLDYRFAFFFLI